MLPAISVKYHGCKCEISRRYTEFKDGVLTYKIYANYAEIASCDKDAAGELIIPSEIEGVPVTSICAGAFYNSDDLVSITIPVSVTEILVLCAALSSNADVEPPDIVFTVCGINTDGKINAVDASLLLAYFADLAVDETLTLDAFLADKIRK